MNDILMKGGLVLALLLLVVQTARLQRRKRHFDAIYDGFERQEKMATLGHLLAGLLEQLGHVGTHVLLLAHQAGRRFGQPGGEPHLLDVIVEGGLPQAPASTDGENGE